MLASFLRSHKARALLNAFIAFKYRLTNPRVDVHVRNRVLNCTSVDNYCKILLSLRL